MLQATAGGLFAAKQNQDLSSRVLWGILEVLPVLAPKGRAVQPLGSHLQGLQTVPRAGGAALRKDEPVRAAGEARDKANSDI